MAGAESGYAMLFIQDGEGTLVERPGDRSQVEQEMQYVCLNLVAGGTKLTAVFQRGDFAKLLAHPNEEMAVEVVFAAEEE